MCGIEGYGLTTTASTGEVPLGVAYNFQYNTTADGTVKYSNCAYVGQKDQTVYASIDDCGPVCAGNPNCDYFSWWGGNCNLKKKVYRGTKSLAANGNSDRCGKVLSRPNFNFVSGSNGLAMYGKNCGYADINGMSLPWQLSDEADCGAVCAATANCAYFGYRTGYCYMTAVANKSSTLVPTPYVSTGYSSCCYITGSTSPPPNWQSASNGQVMSASNCAYIGTDPGDAGVQHKNDVYTTNQDDCASLCAATSTCSYFKWANGWCSLMAIVKPVVYYSTTGNCGYVVNRNTITWTTKGLGQVSTNCNFVGEDYIIWTTTDIFTCRSYCIKDAQCQYFSFSVDGGSCILKTSTSPLVAIYSSTSSCGQVSSRITTR